MPDFSNTPSSSSRIRPEPMENTFPTPPREIIQDSSYRTKGGMSPAPTKLMNLQRAQSTPPEITHCRARGEVVRGSEGILSDVTNLEKSYGRLHLSRKKSQYYEDVFAYRDLNNAAKDRVVRDSIVLADLVLNFNIESEQEFLIDISFRLSEIYQRPVSSIMVKIATNVAIMLGGTFEPAYYLTITAFETEIAATKNKRCTNIIQNFMFDAVQINPKRGLIKFEPIKEENMATNGLTLLQEIELLEEHSDEEDRGLRSLSRQKSKRNRKSITPHFTNRGKTPPPSSRVMSPLQVHSSSEDTGDSKLHHFSEPGRKRVKHRKSFMALFRK